jgi:hypothetical protein
MTETTNEPIKNIVTQYQVEGWEDKKKDGNHSHSKNYLIQDSEGNEENRYPVLDSNKMKINKAKEPNNAYKNNLKEEILQVITRIYGDVTRHG